MRFLARLQMRAVWRAEAKASATMTKMYGDKWPDDTDEWHWLRESYLPWWLKRKEAG